MTYGPLGRNTLFAAFAAILLTAATLGAAATDAPPKDPPPEAEKTASGLATLQLHKGFAEDHPDDNDYVAFHFVLWTPAGAQIQNSYEAGKPMVSLMEKIAPAWKYALKKMVRGEKLRVWIPEHLTPDNASPKGAAICDLELMGLRQIPDLTQEELTPPSDAERTPFGAYSKVVQKGTGTEKAETGIGALAHFTLFTENGQVFDSTVMRGRPTFFPYDRVMAPFADVLKRMVVGETRRIWIPGNVANGNWIGSPKGMLIFETELIRIMDESVLAPPQSEEEGKSG